jgi:hypothetical protein
MDMIRKAEADLTSGASHVFAGPLSDQSGKVRVESGTNLPDADIFAMNWLVEGLEGSLPQ